MIYILTVYPSKERTIMGFTASDSESSRRERAILLSHRSNIKDTLRRLLTDGRCPKLVDPVTCDTIVVTDDYADLLGAALNIKVPLVKLETQGGTQRIWYRFPGGSSPIVKAVEDIASPFRNVQTRKAQEEVAGVDELLRLHAALSTWSRVPSLPPKKSWLFG